MGGTIGAAVFGAVLSSRLTHHLAEQFAGAQGGAQAGAPGGGAIGANNIQAIQALPEPVKHLVLMAFTAAINDVFLVGVPFIVVALSVALFLKEVPLRTAASGSTTADGEPAPVEALSAGL